MKFAIITETNIKKKIKLNFKDNSNTVIIDLEKDKNLDFKPVDLIILLSKKILTRTNPKYKKIISLTNKKSISLIEIAFEKSRLNNEKSYSNAIIYGFKEMTIDIVLKIIKSYKK